MALLTTTKRKEYFKYLGLGEYNKENVKKFEKKYLPSKYVDGEYGDVTDNLLRHCYNVKMYAGTNFKPEEFKCRCGRCSGYPSYMKPAELVNLQKIRTKYGKSMTITSGMRCKSFNSSLKGSSATSKHLTGMAADFYMAGVTDTLARRKSLIAYMKTLPNHNWSYGNGWCSKGYAVSAPNMGNAVHLDSLNVAVSAPKATTTTTTVKKTTTTTAAAAKTPAKTTTTTTVSPAIARGKKVCIAADNLIKKKFGYCYYKKNKGWPTNKGNCIRFGALCLANAGIKVSTKQDGLLNDGWATKLLKQAKSSKATALATWEKRNGKGWKIIFNGGKAIPISMLPEGALLLCYNGNTYKHTAVKHRGKNIADCNPSKGAKIRAYTALNNPCKLAFYYTK